MLLLHCHPEDWNGQLAVVFAPRPPIVFPRRRYVGREFKYDWRANVPEGFTVQRADRSLLDRAGLEIPDDVKNVLEMCGPDDDPAQVGFGFVALHEGKIAAHAVVDCIVGDAGDIGLVTAEDYRRRGLATITSAAAIEYGFSHGLKMIDWECSEDNIGSLRTAEKLGFERERDHTLYLWDYDETWHWIGLTRSHLEAERYRQALDAVEQLIAQQEGVPSFAFHLAASAWVRLGEVDKAFEYLETAVDKGWTSAAYTEDQEEFESLRGTPRWEAVLERMRQNKKGDAG